MSAKRALFVLRAIIMAREEDPKLTRAQLISYACQYGKPWLVTAEEVREVLGKTVESIVLGKT